MAEQLPDEPVDIIGFSLGARTTLALAIENPARFRKIVVAGVGANLFEQDEERAKAIARGVAGDPDPEDRTSGYFAQLAESPEIDKLALAALLRRKRALPVTQPPAGTPATNCTFKATVAHGRAVRVTTA